MKSIARVVCAALLLVPAPAFAHRLDEYLQATLISVDRNCVHAEIRLAPGALVWSRVLRLIDSDKNGIISDAEQRAYASRVLNDLVLSVDGRRLPLRLISVQSASIEFLKEGMGDIRIDFDAVAPAGNGNRRLTFENYHLSAMSVYLVNSLVSSDPEIRIGAQTRNYDQSSYRLDYVEGSAASASRMSGSWSDAWTAFASMVPRGMRHIAEGTDHLLFLLVLLLPAPLIAVGGRWGAHGGPRYGVMRLLRIVTAFTIGHSITLALAATNVVTAPSRPVEVLIAVSILVSAIHAIRPLFPGREEFVAGAFGLVHGLAFATMIAGYGIDTWHTALTVFGFNVGIELMQLTVVGLTVPWLFLLARTRAYGLVRVSAAGASAVAASAWIGQRALGQDTLAALLNASTGRGVILSSLVLISLCTAGVLRFRYNDKNS